MKSESLNLHTGCSEQRGQLAIMALRAEYVTLSQRIPKGVHLIAATIEGQMRKTFHGWTSK